MTLATLLKFNLRYYRRHRMLALLCLMGISLGVGIVIAVELINDSALKSFASSVDFLSGKADYSIISEYGRIDEKKFLEIWRNPKSRAASPIIETMADTVETSPEAVRFIGIDPFFDRQIRGFVPQNGESIDFIKFLGGSPPGAYASEYLLKKFRLNAGDFLNISVAGIDHKIKLLGKIPVQTPGNENENLVIMDISAAQEIFGKLGVLDRIDIISPHSKEDYSTDLPDGLKLTSANDRKSTLQAMLYSFQLNLAAMSLLALFVGVFLIYNFSMFSVLSRREDISLLLTLGADRKSLVTSFLMESALLGILGSLLGIFFGYIVAWWSIDRVTGTISELYFHVHASQVVLTPALAIAGLFIGFAATLTGIAMPALEVAVTPPVLGMKRRSIEDKAHGVKGLLFFAGIFCSLVAAVCAWASRYSIFWGFVSAFALTLAFALFTPSFLSPFSHYTGLLVKKGLKSLEGFLAARTIKASLSRTSIAVAALATALSMTIGVDTMIYSFRNSVKAWLDGSLQGDVYISPGTTKWDHPLPPELIEFTTQHPMVDAVERYSTHEVYLQGKPVRIRVMEAEILEPRAEFTFLQGKTGAWDRLKAGQVFVSESLSYKFEVGIGDKIQLNTPKGQSEFTIGAITRDYSSDQGTIQIDRAVYESIWNDTRVQSISLFLKPGASYEEVRKAVIDKFPGLDQTFVSNAKMRENILVIFDKTFAPTATLKGVSLLVALLGIATALMAILMERSREMAVLGYLGLTPRELGKMNVYQAISMGFASFLIAAVCGLILTLIIIYAINYRSFGWSIDIYIDPGIFAKTLVLTIIACAASSFYPTLKLVRSGGIRNLDEE